MRFRFLSFACSDLGVSPQYQSSLRSAVQATIKLITKIEAKTFSLKVSFFTHTRKVSKVNSEDRRVRSSWQY